MDHDQRFKGLVPTFLAGFVRLVLPDWADRFDYGRVEWLQTEAFLDPPQGEKHDLDLVAKLPIRRPLAAPYSGAEVWLALIHVEVESPDRATTIRERMPDYAWVLRRRFRLPVLPIVLFLNVGLDGFGWMTFEEKFWDRTIFRMEYAYMGLPALDGQAHIKGDNWLGVALAALMRLPKEGRPELKAEAINRLADAPLTDAQRYMLAECVQAYFPLNPAEVAEYAQLTEEPRFRKGKQMAI